MITHGARGKPNHGQGLDFSGRGGGGVEDALVVGLVAWDYVIGAEILFGVEAGALAHFAAAVFAREDVESIAAGGFYRDASRWALRWGPILRAELRQAGACRGRS